MMFRETIAEFSPDNQYATGANINEATQSCRNANFVITEGTADCHNDSPR